MADAQLNQGLAKRVRAAEVAAGIVAYDGAGDATTTAKTKTDRFAIARRLRKLESVQGLAATAADKIRNNRMGVENRIRAIFATLVIVLALFMPSLAQATPVPYKNALVTYDSVDPTGGCSGFQKLWWNTTSNVLFFCEGGTWVSSIAAAVTSFPLLATDNANPIDCGDPAEGELQYGFLGSEAGLCRNANSDWMVIRNEDANGYINVIWDMDGYEFTVKAENTSSVSSSRFRSSHNRLDWVRLAGAVVTSPALRLIDAANDFLTFTDVEAPANVITFSQDTTAPSLTKTLTNGTSTTSVAQTATIFSASIAGAVDGTFNLDLSDSAANDFLVFTDVADPNKTITFTKDASGPRQAITVRDVTAASAIQIAMNLDSSTLQVSAGDAGGGTTLSMSSNSADPSLSLLSSVGDTYGLVSVNALSGVSIARNDGDGTEENSINLQVDGVIAHNASNGANYTTMDIAPKGFRVSGLLDAAAAAPFLASLVKGGYALGGTTTSGSPDTVKVTVVDTTPSITDGDVQVCGFATTAHQTAAGPVTCETRDFSGGAGNQTTTQTYVEVLYVKSSSFTVLGGGGDETVAAEWTTGAVSILAAVGLTNSGASNYSASFPTGLSDSNFAAIKCLDLEGCTMGIPAGTKPGQELTLAVLDGSTSLTFADSATMKVSASHTFDGFDTIRFIYSPTNTAWLQVSFAVN